MNGMRGLGALVLPLAAVSAAPTGSSALYEDLYRHGYHSDLKLSHAKDALLAIADGTPSVLDVGCSHGFAVAQLWGRGVVANGVDISPTAVQLATTARRAAESGRCGGRPCFQVGSATSLPFPDKSFNTLLSTDVLEHLLPEEVDRAVAEMARVTQAHMWLKIATRAEVNTAPLDDAHRRRRHAEVKRLHATVMSLDKWAAAFRRHPHVAKVAVERGMVHVVLSSPP